MMGLNVMRLNAMRESRSPHTVPSSLGTASVLWCFGSLVLWFFARRNFPEHLNAARFGQNSADSYHLARPPSFRSAIPPSSPRRVVYRRPS
jgi:hypothetical protein